jgi:hypothetical protein
VLTKNEFEKNMFANSLEVPWTERARRGSTLLTSFGLQALVVSALLLLPLLRPAGFPSFHQLSSPISLAPYTGDTAPVRTHSDSRSVSIIPPDNALRMPTHIPRGAPYELRCWSAGDRESGHLHRPGQRQWRSARSDQFVWWIAPGRTASSGTGRSYDSAVAYE